MTTPGKTTCRLRCCSRRLAVAAVTADTATVFTPRTAPVGAENAHDATDPPIGMLDVVAFDAFTVGAAVVFRRFDVDGHVVRVVPRVVRVVPRVVRVVSRVVHVVVLNFHRVVPVVDRVVHVVDRVVHVVDRVVRVVGAIDNDKVKNFSDKFPYIAARIR